MHILVTGGAGFIGSNYVDLVFRQHPEDQVTVLDALTYAGSLRNIEQWQGDPRFRFVHGDIADAALVDQVVSETDAVVNFAAETHVDRSLIDPEAFLRANVHGVYVLLDAARRHGRRMVHVSTDEVYGDIPEGQFSTEQDRLVPRSPYSAAKAGGEMLCLSFAASFGTDVLITRGCNTVGPRQYPEKMLPLFITNALQDEPLPVYGDGMQVRDWLHAEDHAAAIDLVLRRGRAGEIYNIGADNERPNLDVVRAILARLGKDESLIRLVPDRPGHDRRYALDWAKIRDDLGWSPARGFAETLNDTIDWYVEHPAWWKAIREDSGDFKAYYQEQYGWRLNAATSITSWERRIMDQRPSGRDTTDDAIRACLVTSAADPSRIDGAVLRELVTHRDPRGTLTELLKADWPEVYGEDMPFAQVYTSTTAPGVARDIDKWHLHQHQTDRFYCLRGRIVVAIADPRQDSPTHGTLMLVELAAAEDGPAPLLVTIPPRTLHGFVVTSAEPAVLLNFPNRLYDPSDEGRVPFDEAAVTFPDGTPFSYDAVQAWYASR